jgi:uncharacterized protein YecT (DUF1311 family)
MYLKRIVFIIVILAVPFMVYADCDNPRDDFDGLYCLNKIYIQADKDLNTAYQKLQKQLDSEGKDLLKKSQIRWIESRNSECSYMNENGFFVNLKCAAETTIERTNFLNDRYRECMSSGCLKSKLK